jgi:hypothetical protein
MYTYIHIQYTGITNKVDLIKLGASDWSLRSGYLDEKPLISGNNTQGINIYLDIYLFECMF